MRICLWWTQLSPPFSTLPCSDVLAPGLRTLTLASTMTLMDNSTLHWALTGNAPLSNTYFCSVLVWTPRHFYVHHVAKRKKKNWEDAGWQAEKRAKYCGGLQHAQSCQFTTRESTLQHDGWAPLGQMTSALILLSADNKAIVFRLITDHQTIRFTVSLSFPAVCHSHTCTSFFFFNLFSYAA